MVQYSNINEAVDAFVNQTGYIAPDNTNISFSPNDVTIWHRIVALTYESERDNINLRKAIDLFGRDIIEFICLHGNSNLLAKMWKEEIEA